MKVDPIVPEDINTVQLHDKKGSVTNFLLNSYSYLFQLDRLLYLIHSNIFLLY
uniref:Uncharacterized protein n=1 Tax=Lepeophtheirus salmonis TaxID=72036 RepID=A0A0K2U9T8_LEPSM